MSDSIENKNKINKIGHLFLIALILLELVLTAIIFTGTNTVLTRKTARNRLYDLLNSPLETDIFFIGTSIIEDGVVPVELWSQKGYTSYILTSEYNDMDRDIMKLRLAMQYKKPKLVVLDVNNFWEKSDPENVLNAYQEYTDAFPLSKEKIKTTFELYQDFTSRVRILCPLYIYHSRWDELKTGDFRINNDSFFLKGHEYSAEVSETNIPAPIDPSEGYLPEVYGIETIKEFVGFCRANDIEVMLVSLPVDATYQEHQLTVGLSDFADDLGVKYLNFLQMEGVVDPASDFKDSSHLNINGAIKATDIVGDFIADNYNITDRRNDPIYSDSWNSAAEKFRQLREKNE